MSAYMCIRQVGSLGYFPQPTFRLFPTAHLRCLRLFAGPPLAYRLSKPNRGHKGAALISPPFLWYLCCKSGITCVSGVNNCGVISGAMSLAVMLAAGCCHSTCVMCLLRCTCGMWWSSALVARRCSAVAASLRRCSAVYPLCHACYSLQCAACWIACCSVINSNRLSLRTLASYFPAQYILALVRIYVIVLEWLIVLIQCSSVRCAFLTRATTFFFVKCVAMLCTCPVYV